ncbi:MAG: DUF5658 family protein [Myxococcota bacterium]
MRFFLGVLVVLFNMADNATTFLCLRQQVPGFEIFEANPLARWLFEAMGLVEGLIFEMCVTTAAVAFLIWTTRVPHTVKLYILGVLAVLPAWAATNNYMVIRTLSVPLDWL